MLSFSLQQRGHLSTATKRNFSPVLQYKSLSIFAGMCRKHTNFSESQNTFFIADIPRESFHITGIWTHCSHRTGHSVIIQFLWGHLSTDEVKDKSQVKLLLTKKSIGYFTTKLENKTKGERGEQQPCQGIPKTHLCCLLLHMNFPWNSWELPWPQSLQKDTTKLAFTLYHSSQQATFLIILP